MTVPERVLAGVRPFRGAKRTMFLLGGIGAVAFAFTIVWMLVVSPKQTLYSYLVGWTFWAGIAIGATGWLAAFHAAHARWLTSIRRVLEIETAPVILLFILFLPIAIGVRRIYLWADWSRAPSAHVRELLEHKHVYLNLPFFYARTGFYFICWTVISHLLHLWSKRQDESGDLRLTIRSRMLGAAALPVIGLTISFASFDWVMSLQATWYSTIFGLYILAGFMAASMAVLILAVLWAERAGLLRGLITFSHFHAMGNYLFTFVCFWAYLAFSQYMLIWIGNLPEENTFLLLRQRHGWGALGVVLALGHFAGPFLLLLPQKVKRDPVMLSALAVWMLVMHWIDLYWLIMPRLRPGSPMVHIGDLSTFVALGGLSIAFALWRFRGLNPVPIRDPYIGPSTRYNPS